MSTAYAFKERGRIVAVAKTRKELVDTYYRDGAKIVRMKLVPIAKRKNK